MSVASFPRSAAVITAFFVFELPRVALQGHKGSLKESVVDYVGFTVLALHNPVAFRHVAEAGIGRNRFGGFALGGVYQERSDRTECTHRKPPLAIKGQHPHYSTLAIKSPPGSC